jgi:hypothetical protein
MPGMHVGGTGWIIDPENGTLLAATTAREPLVTMDIEPGWAEAATGTYPRDVPE